MGKDIYPELPDFVNEYLEGRALKGSFTNFEPNVVTMHEVFLEDLKKFPARVRGKLQTSLDGLANVGELVDAMGGADEWDQDVGEMVKDVRTVAMALCDNVRCDIEEMDLCLGILDGIKAALEDYIDNSEKVEVDVEKKYREALADHLQLWLAAIHYGILYGYNSNPKHKKKLEDAYAVEGVKVKPVFPSAAKIVKNEYLK